MDQEKRQKQIVWIKESKGPAIIAGVLLAVVIVLFALFQVGGTKDHEAEVTVVSTLERIINVSDLSTFTAVYNGIAEVPNERNPDKVDYYVSYEARVEAGIDFSAVEISMENGVITVDIPNVKINGLWINLWDFASKLTPAFAGGTAPDVVLGSTLAQDAAEGNIVNLTEALEERGFDESRYLPGAIEAMTYDGDYYGIPFVGGTRLFYWNKDIFEAAGLDPDQPPATWEEVAQFAEKTTTFDEDGNATILGFHHEYSNLYAWTTLWTYGVELMDGECVIPIVRIFLASAGANIVIGPFVLPAENT